MVEFEGRRIDADLTLAAEKAVAEWRFPNLEGAATLGVLRRGDREWPLTAAWMSHSARAGASDGERVFLAKRVGVLFAKMRAEKFAERLFSDVWSGRLRGGERRRISCDPWDGGGGRRGFDKWGHAPSMEPAVDAVWLGLEMDHRFGVRPNTLTLGCRVPLEALCPTEDALRVRLGEGFRVFRMPEFQEDRLNRCGWLGHVAREKLPADELEKTVPRTAMAVVYCEAADESPAVTFDRGGVVAGVEAVRGMCADEIRVVSPDMGILIENIV